MGSSSAGESAAEPSFDAGRNFGSVSSEGGCGVSGGNSGHIACEDTPGDTGGSAFTAHKVGSCGAGKSGDVGVNSSCIARGASLDSSYNSAFSAHKPDSGGVGKPGDANNFVSVTTKLGSGISGNPGCVANGAVNDCAGASSLDATKTGCDDDASNCVCI